jgi:hypothetical protein
MHIFHAELKTIVDELSDTAKGGQLVLTIRGEMGSLISLLSTVHSGNSTPASAADIASVVNTSNFQPSLPGVPLEATPPVAVEPALETESAKERKVRGKKAESAGVVRSAEVAVPALAPTPAKAALVVTPTVDWVSPPESTAQIAAPHKGGNGLLTFADFKNVGLRGIIEALKANGQCTTVDDFVAWARMNKAGIQVLSSGSDEQLEKRVSNAWNFVESQARV